MELEHPTSSIVIGIVLSIVVFAALPFGLIWALNGLLDLTIPYDFFHWSCAFVAIAVFNVRLSK